MEKRIIILIHTILVILTIDLEKVMVMVKDAWEKKPMKLNNYEKP